jgi:hypothetical protein
LPQAIKYEIIKQDKAFDDDLRLISTSFNSAANIKTMQEIKNKKEDRTNEISSLRKPNQYHINCH